jgi:hypothetical protein
MLLYDWDNANRILFYMVEVMEMEVVDTEVNKKRFFIIITITIFR